MTTASAPSELPFTLTPFRGELFSSWLLRVAAANFVSIDELMLGFQSRYPEAPCPHSFDMGLDPQFRKLMAQFCRISARTLRSLDLGARLPGPGRVLIRSFRTPPLRCPRLRVKRLGYSFCPTCISEQRYVHVRWDWTFPVLLRCHPHQIPLMHGCPVCDDDDPLPFGADPNITPILCSNCGADLIGANPDSTCSQVGAAQIVIEKLYRDALYGRSSRVALLQKATGIQFRRFVDDIFQLLCWYPSPALPPSLTDPRNEHLAFRTTVLETVAALVVDATSSTEPNGAYLWLRVLSLLSTREEELIESTSELWPATLSGRLHSALDQYGRSRLLGSPFRSTLFRPGFKYINSSEFRDLGAGNEVRV